MEEPHSPCGQSSMNPHDLGFVDTPRYTAFPDCEPSSLSLFPSPSSPGRPSPSPLVWRRAPEAGERDATEVDFPPGETDWHGQMVRVRGLVARPDLNGALGYAQGVGGSSDRVAVLVNPLGGEDFPAEVISVRRERLALFEGHRREDAGAVGGAGGAAALDVAPEGGPCCKPNYVRPIFYPYP